MPDIDDPCFEQDSSGGDSGEINPADILLAAMNFLARREHTLRELQQKLKKRFPSEDLVQVILMASIRLFALLFLRLCQR